MRAFTPNALTATLLAAIAACIAPRPVSAHSAPVGTNLSGTVVDTTLKVTNTFTEGNGIGIHASSAVENGVGVYGRADGLNGVGMVASSVSSAGLRAEGGTFGVNAKGTTAGVFATSVEGPGVRGFSSSNSGVYGESPTNGVLGVATTNGVGVTGMGSTGIVGHGNAVAGASNGIGVYALGSGGITSYGIYATADSGRDAAWAGWFDGNVAITGECTPCVISDARTKKNIRPLNGSLDKILAMRARSYEMRNDEYASRMNLAKGSQDGLIAQELELIVPEAVHPVVAPPHYTSDELQRGVKKDNVVLKSVNYTALIPILIAAIQEQQDEIRQQQAEIKALQARH